jgi:hypothetical protein
MEKQNDKKELTDKQFCCCPPPSILDDIPKGCPEPIAPSIESIKIYIKSKSITDRQGRYLGQWELSEDKKAIIVTNDPLILCVGHEEKTREPIIIDANNDPNSLPHSDIPKITYTISCEGNDLSFLLDK